jgi:hypothetical protein
MAVALPLAPSVAPAPRTPSLWELGIELAADTHWIVQLADRLHAGDEADHAQAISDLEAALTAEESHREALHKKADATCWVIDRLRAEAAYHQAQAKRFSALAATETSRADSLESTLISLLTRLFPQATRFQFPDHLLTSRKSSAVAITDEAAIPPQWLTVKTTTSPDKAAIKEALKAGHLIPGAHLLSRRLWSIH